MLAYLYTCSSSCCRFCIILPILHLHICILAHPLVVGVASVYPPPIKFNILHYLAYFAYLHICILAHRVVVGFAFIHPPPTILNTLHYLAYSAYLHICILAHLLVVGVASVHPPSASALCLILCFTPPTIW